MAVLGLARSRGKHARPRRTSLHHLIAPTAAMMIAVALGTAAAPINAGTTRQNPTWVPFMGSAQVGCTVSAEDRVGCADGYHPWPAIDLHLPHGAAIRAAGPGTVVRVAHAPTGGVEEQRAGLHIAIAHDDGPYSVYKHLAEAVVRPGDPVHPGQIIGLAGRTASPTYHLHYDEQSGLADFNQPGNRLDFGSMQALIGDDELEYPSDAVWSDNGWQDVERGTRLIHDPEPDAVVSSELELRGVLGALSDDDDPAPALVEVDGRVQVDDVITYDGDRPVLLRGAGDRAEIVGAGRAGLLEVTTSAALELESLRLSGGRASTGAAVHSAGPVTVVDSELVDNRAERSGGAVRAAGHVALIRTTVSENHADDDGGGVAAPSVHVVETTLNANRAGGDGGAVATTGDVWVATSTASDNEAGRGGAVAAGGDIRLRHATLTEGTADVGALVWAGRDLDTQTTIFDRPVGATACAVEGSTISRGHNLSADRSCTPPVDTAEGTDDDGAPTTTDIVDTEAELGPLAPNGGPTRTHLPLPGSPAIDAYISLDESFVGERHPLQCDPTSEADQRGDGSDAFAADALSPSWRPEYARPVGVGCDIGAVEAPSWSTPSGADRL